METGTIVKLNKCFEEHAYEQDGIEYWLARELQELLDYTQWRNFVNVIDKAKMACQNSGNAIADHFADVSKMVNLGSGAEREIDDIMLELRKITIKKARLSTGFYSFHLVTFRKTKEA